MTALIVEAYTSFGDAQLTARDSIPVEAFAADYHAIALAPLGHGRSQVRSGNVTVERAADLLAEILSAEGHTWAHLVGVSLGSLIAQHVAHRFPDMARTITVVGGYGILGDNSGIVKAQRGEMFKWLFLMLFSMDRFRRYVEEVSRPVEP